MNIQRIKRGLHLIISPFHGFTQVGRSGFGSLFSHAVVSPLSLQEFKGIFDVELKKFFDEKREYIASISSKAETPSVLRLYDQAVAITLAGGKRIRPYMAFLSYVSTAQYSHLSREQVVRSVICLELFHAFALIHDDIIDMSDERHGLKTVHAFFTEMSHVPFPNDIAHQSGDVRIGAPIARVGRSHALMIGDLFFSLAHESIAKFVPVHIQPAVREYFDTMASEVVIGEMIDVHQTLLNSVDDEGIRQKNNLKTARYTFVNPIKIGFALAGERVSLVHTEQQTEHNQELLHFADEFGSSLGFGFQVQDDLLDLVGTEAHTGKPVLLDIAEGQHTIFTQYILLFNHKQGDDHRHEYHQGHISDQDIQRFKSLLGKKELHGSFLTAQEGAFVRDLMEKTGAIAYGKRLIRDAIEEALASLQRVHISHKTYWEEIVTRIKKRNN